MIAVSHLSKSFGSFQAVDDLSFTVNKGDVYGFLGQNGAGKSTTIRMLVSLIHPTSGSIQINGMHLSNNRNGILNRIGAMIERPDLYKYLSAYDNLKVFARMSGIDVSRSLLMKTLERVGLADRAHSKAGTFSQGMKQRLGLAIATVHDPDIILLDEPTNGLDPQGIAEIREMIKGFSNDWGKTVLVSSHLLSEMELMANRMLIIHKGKKIIEGSVHELLHPEKTRVTLSCTRPSEAIDILADSSWASALLEADDTVVLTMSKERIPELARWLCEKGIDILSLSHRHTLEDYFIRLTQNN